MDNISNPSSKFFIAASFLGVASLVFMCTFFLPLPLGALGILFVILGKRRNRKLNGAAITGLVTSLIGCICGLLVTVLSLVSAYTLLKPENHELLNSQFEQVYGVNFDEYMERLYGDDYETYMEDFYSIYE